jgi:hypothetical protein
MQHNTWKDILLSNKKILLAKAQIHIEILKSIVENNKKNGKIRKRK